MSVENLVTSLNFTLLSRHYGVDFWDLMTDMKIWFTDDVETKDFFFL
jgi:hypothetical protein